MKKKLLSLLLVLLSILVLPNIVLAEEAIEEATILGIVANVINIIVIVATALVIIFWIITGLLFLFAQGQPEKISLAKKALFAAIAGTVIFILAQVATTIIGNALFFGF